MFKLMFNSLGDIILTSHDHFSYIQVGTRYIEVAMGAMADFTVNNFPRVFTVL